MHFFVAFCSNQPKILVHGLVHKANRDVLPFALLSMASTKFYLDCRRAKPGQSSVLKIVISHNSKTSYISLDARLLPSQWDALTERVKDIPDKVSVNALVDRPTFQ